MKRGRKRLTFSSKVQVIATGTIEPALICSSISCPIFDSGLLRSSLSKSPADK
jgi:hypothetical protein